MTAAPAVVSPTRIISHWRYVSRTAWLIFFLLVVGKIAIGLPLRFEQIRKACTQPVEICSQMDYLTPQQIQSLAPSGISLAAYANLDLALFLVTALIWAGIGLFIIVMRPDDWMAFLASAMMIVFPSAGLETEIRAAYPSLGAASDFLFNLGNIIMFLFIGLFPGGRFSPGWMRWYWTGMILTGILPSEVWSLNREIADIVLVIYWISFLILGPFSQIYRYWKESTPIQRQQTKWVVLGFAVFAGSVLISFALITLFPENNPGRILYNAYFFDITGLLIPLSVSFSILRYRLWDVDLLIRRTMQYSLITGMLALIYFGGVTVLQGIFSALGGSQSTAATVISTLAIAALFTPLRRRIQELIDRRFYRSKYNAEIALTQFAATARNETRIESITNDLVGAVQAALQPAQASLWVRSTAPNRSSVQSRDEKV